MKKIALLTMLIVVCGIVAVASRTLIEPSKKSVTKSFNITNFNEIKVTGVYEVEYEQTSGNIWSVEVTAPDNIMPFVKVSRSRDCLVLSLEKGFSTRGSYSLKAKVKAPAVEEIDLAGASSLKAGKINLAGRVFEIDAKGASKFDIKSVVATKLEADMSGASNLKIGNVVADAVEIDAEGASDVNVAGITAANVEVDASGASDVSLGGKAEYVEIEASGASTVIAKSLKAVSGKLEASGASDIKCNVANVLQQRASGASSIKNEK